MTQHLPLSRWSQALFRQRRWEAEQLTGGGGSTGRDGEGAELFSQQLARTRQRAMTQQLHWNQLQVRSPQPPAREDPAASVKPAMPEPAASMKREGTAVRED